MPGSIAMQDQACRGLAKWRLVVIRGGGATGVGAAGIGCPLDSTYPSIRRWRQAQPSAAGSAWLPQPNRESSNPVPLPPGLPACGRWRSPSIARPPFVERRFADAMLPAQIARRQPGGVFLQHLNFRIRPRSLLCDRRSCCCVNRLGRHKPLTVNAQPASFWNASTAVSVAGPK